MSSTTIIMPVFNAAETLERAINSVDKCVERAERLSLIAIDDHSTDFSLALLKHLALTRPYLSVYQSTENTGPGRTRNIALEMTTSEFIGFLDADDELNPREYAQLVNSLPTRNVDLVTFNATVEYDHGTTSRYDFDRLVEDNVGRTQLCVRGELDGSVIFSLYSRALIEKYQIRFEDFYFEDIPFCYKALMSSEQFLIYPHTCYRKHNVAGSILNSLSERHIEGLLHASFEVYEFASNLPWIEETDIIADHSYCLAGYLANILERIEKVGSPQTQVELLDCLNTKARKYGIHKYKRFTDTPKGRIANQYLQALQGGKDFKIEQIQDIKIKTKNTPITERDF